MKNKISKNSVEKYCIHFQSNAYIPCEEQPHKLLKEAGVMI